jgi:hypothetical protein
VERNVVYLILDFVLLRITKGLKTSKVLNYPTQRYGDDKIALSCVVFAALLYDISLL